MLPTAGDNVLDYSSAGFRSNRPAAVRKPHIKFNIYKYSQYQLPIIWCLAKSIVFYISLFNCNLPESIFVLSNTCSFIHCCF